MGRELAMEKDHGEEGAEAACRWVSALSKLGRAVGAGANTPWWVPNPSWDRGWTALHQEQCRVRTGCGAGFPWTFSASGVGVVM